MRRALNSQKRWFLARAVMRVWVNVEVLDPREPERMHRRTNKLLFVFLAPDDPPLEVVPDSYSECLMYLAARRWHRWQGPSPGELIERGVLTE